MGRGAFRSESVILHACPILQLYVYVRVRLQPYAVGQPQLCGALVVTRAARSAQRVAQSANWRSCGTHARCQPGCM